MQSWMLQRLVSIESLVSCTFPRHIYSHRFSYLTAVVSYVSINTGRGTSSMYNKDELLEDTKNMTRHEKNECWNIAISSKNPS